MKQYTLTNRVLAGVSFLITLITYTLTLQPSVPFWDCGEFSAATAWQQVPHPPGAPLFLLVARWFHMIPIGDPGWRINMVSAVASAFTAALVYLITVKLIERWRPFKENRSTASYVGTYGGGLIAALAFTWSDTQWFNSVESEVYAAGTTLIAVLIWLMMRWDERAERVGHERYLLAIAYVTGLAFGIHLLALLVIPAVGMVIYFRKFRFSIPSFIGALAIIGVAFMGIIYKTPLTFIPKAIAASPVLGVLIVAALVGAAWWGVKNKNSIVYLSSASVLLILLGFSTYAHILLRANAHPAMNENEPDTVSELVSYLGREQYGNRDWWPRRQETEDYYRRYQDQYGPWDPPISQNEDGTYKYAKVYAGAELNFMFKYQVYHMYLRYLFWNFVGRASDIQDAPVAFSGVQQKTRDEFITPTGYTDVFPVRFFALPLILGLIGLVYHFRRDWKMAVVYSTLFLLLGVIAALQQNQQEPQPRERDYFYVGSFMVFAMWIGLGVSALADAVTKRTSAASEEEADQSTESKTGLVAVVVCLGFLAVPINMVVGGWKLHDRSKNWVPWDYAYNILQSCEKDAILFTNGDNDTFPLWYMQDVAGVRRDVRVVNLSLGQTSWYIWQLKNERPWGAQKVPISFTDEQLRLPERDERALHPQVLGDNATEMLDVPANVMAWATNGTVKEPGKMTWQMVGMNYGDRQLLGVQHMLVRDILRTNKWQRPVYFSTSTQSDVWCGLKEYFRSEGMAYRIMPVKQVPNPLTDVAMNMDVMRKCLLGTLPADQHFTEPHYGFKFRNLDDPNTFFMEDHRRLMINYRLMYISLANEELAQKNPAGAIATLDKLEALIHPDMFAIPYPFTAEIANIYRQAGQKEKAAKYAKKTLSALDAGGQSYNMNPQQVRAQMLAALGDYDGAIKVFEDALKQNPGDPNIRGQIDNLTLDKYLSKNDTTGAVAELQKRIAAYEGDSSGAMQANAAALRMRLTELTGRAALTSGAIDSSKPAVADSGAR